MCAGNEIHRRKIYEISKSKEKAVHRCSQLRNLPMNNITLIVKGLRNLPVRRFASVITESGYIIIIVASATVIGKFAQSPVSNFETSILSVKLPITSNRSHLSDR